MRTLFAGSTKTVKSRGISETQHNSFVDGELCRVFASLGSQNGETSPPLAACQSRGNSGPKSLRDSCLEHVSDFSFPFGMMLAFAGATTGLVP
jgi:hypothetical protein